MLYYFKPLAVKTLDAIKRESRDLRSYCGMGASQQSMRTMYRSEPEAPALPIMAMVSKNDAFGSGRDKKPASVEKIAINSDDISKIEPAVLFHEKDVDDYLYESQKNEDIMSTFGLGCSFSPSSYIARIAHLFLDEKLSFEGSALTARDGTVYIVGKPICDLMRELKALGEDTNAEDSELDSDSIQTKI